MAPVGLHEIFINLEPYAKKYINFKDIKVGKPFKESTSTDFLLFLLYAFSLAHGEIFDGASSICYAILSLTALETNIFSNCFLPYKHDSRL
jgi:hypothetical protein